MTIAVGFLCHNGLVLCTDSLEEDGYSKHYVNKIAFNYHPEENWGLAIAGAGDSAVFSTFVDRLRPSLDGLPFERAKIENVVGTAFEAARRKYRDTPFRILVGLVGKYPNYWGCHLYRDNNENCLERVKKASAGMGTDLCTVFFRNIADWRMTVDEAAHLAVNIVALAKDYVDGCGGEINLAIYRPSSHQHTFESHYQEMGSLDTERLERRYKRLFAGALNAYWNEQRRGLPPRYRTPYDIARGKRRKPRL